MPFTPLGKKAEVTTPKDIYMVDFPPLSNLVCFAALLHSPLGFILKEYDNLIWVCVGKDAALGELLVFLARLSYQVLSPLILALESRV